MNVVNSIIHVVSQVFTDTVFVITLYFLCLSFFGIYRKKDSREVKLEKSFALIVAAHNEEAVIADMVVSLKRLDYPKELYDIFVIADNCTDKTALKARENGAIVYERFNKEKRGKGFALEWMFEKIFNLEKKYDSVVVFDADNLADKNFLKAMNKKLCEGYKVVQGYLDSKNPKDTWITASYSIAFWQSNRMFQLSRSNIGLSNQLGGTGFCVNTEILKQLGWGATCLTEDLEFTCKLVLSGYKVGWAHDAIVYDEKPLTLMQSWWQRKRWMQGFADVSSRYFFKLLKKGIKDRDFKAIDCAIYSIQPILIVLISVSMLISAFQYVIRAAHTLSNLSSAMAVFNLNAVALTAIVIGILQFIYTPFLLFLDRKLNVKIFLYYLIYSIYAITWLPITIQGIMDKDNKEWSHTIHTRSVDISDLEKAN
ncbi:MAG: glycosyltransferase family 2 protein [Bacillota bacterium]|nr:glycosyltransferase family 2 protein [Bacillota bacterium]